MGGGDAGYSWLLLSLSTWWSAAASCCCLPAARLWCQPWGVVNVAWSCQHR